MVRCGLERSWIMMEATHERSRIPYRPPEMGGPPLLARRGGNADVMRQPGTVAALLLAVAVVVGLVVMYVGTT
jgi:hypothetical protein